MPQISVRFAISDGMSRRAATWKCFAQIGQGKDDVYITCRELKGAIKTSLHRDGRCHLAYEHAFFAEDVPDASRPATGRFIDKWITPPELSPGLTLALRILTPSSAVTVPYDRANYPGIVRIPNAPAAMATQIDVLIAKLPIANNQWPGQNSMSTNLVGRLSLDSGAVAYVIHWVVPMPRFPASHSGTPRYFRDNGVQDLETGSLRLLAFGEEPDGPRVLYDCHAEFDPYSRYSAD